MKNILMATALCGWVGVAHAASFPDTFVAEADGEGALPAGVILSVDTDADGREIAASAEARAIDASDLVADDGAALDPETLFESGRPLTVADFSPEMYPDLTTTLVLPNIINIVTHVATTSGRYGYGRYGRYGYDRRGSWHRPYRHYYYYHRCGRYHRCR